MYIETQRLILREFKIEDLDGLLPILCDPKVMKYSPTGPCTREEAKQYLQDKILNDYEACGYGLWAIVLKQTQTIIGLIGPSQLEIDGKIKVEVSYKLASSQWGKGLATEALKAVRDDAFSRLDLDELIAVVLPENTLSCRVLEKAGFIFLKETLFHAKLMHIYHMSRLTLISYSTKWKEQFEKEKNKLQNVFGGFPILFYHIGSTSVPHCHAKPIIDILGVTPDITAIDHYDEAMKKIGYSPLGEYFVKQRRFFIREGKTNVHLHIFEDSDPETIRHLRFRDYMRDHPKCVEEYSTLKLDLAKKYPANRQQYTLGKKAFIKQIDYQSALEDSKKYVFFKEAVRKQTWLDEEILKAMEANMYVNMTYFANYLPSLKIAFKTDVIQVSSAISDDTFNYVFGAKFKTYDVKERVSNLLNDYQEKKLPFSWWVGPKDTPNHLEKELIAQGLQFKEEDIGMYLPLKNYNCFLVPLDISIERVLDKKGLENFAKVFASIGGYPHLYQEVYSQIPPSLIREDAPFEMYVGYHHQVPVLTGILILHASVGGIYYVMTTPDQRRKGFGTYMMTYLISKAKEKGYSMITLQASSAGKKLYETLGFQSLCRFTEYA